MNMKNKLKRFFTLSRNHDGFTLVELIVVIAIMAILAGVGSVGYAGYIKSANKKADMVLVGNIMRAIETGTNSTMFVNDDSFKMGKISYPVGFVALSTNGSKVVASKTKINEAVETGSCNFLPIEGILVETSTIKSSGCYSNETDTIYSVTQDTLYYCETHSPAPQIVDATGTYISDYTHSGTNKDYVVYKTCKNHKWEPVYLAYPSGAKRISNQSALFTEKASGLCEYAYANQNATFDTTTTNIAPVTDGALYDAIIAAFGTTDNMMLKYDGWAKEEGFDYATILSSADDLISNVKDTANTLLGAKDIPIIGGIISPYIDNYLSEDYEDPEDMMESFSGHMMSQYPSNENGEWDTVWKNAATHGNNDYTFGMGKDGVYHHDYVYAATKGYNSCFASYCTSNEVPSAFTSVIENYTSPPNENNAALAIADIIPRTVNTAAFEGAHSTNSDTTLKDKFIAAGQDAGYTEEQSIAYFNECYGLYKDYIDSGACEENGKVFYNMMNTVNETSDIARNENNTAGGDYFAYYDGYLGEMSALYTAAESAADGGIVIIVTVENGKLNFQVSPSAANPRPLND